MDALKTVRNERAVINSRTSHAGVSYLAIYREWHNWATRAKYRAYFNQNQGAENVSRKFLIATSIAVACGRRYQRSKTHARASSGYEFWAEKATSKE